MDKIKGLYPLMDIVSIGIFGMTIVDVGVMMSGVDYNIIKMSNTVKLIISIVSIVYLAVIRIPHAYYMNKLNRKEKYLQNQVLKEEIEDRKERKRKNQKPSKTNEISKTKEHSEK